jgi:hypothetical protein
MCFAQYLEKKNFDFGPKIFIQKFLKFYFSLKIIGVSLEIDFDLI